MNFDAYEYYVSEHWLPAIFNDDFSGLDDDDETILRDFLTSVQNECGHGHWSWPDDEMEDFTRCEVSNLHAYCLKLTYNAER